MSVIQSQFVIGFDSATISSSSQTLVDVGFTLAQILRASEAFITVETNSIRIRYDGTAPTTTEGHLLTAGSSLTLVGNQQIRNLKMIAAAADGAVKVTLEGRNAS